MTSNMVTIEASANPSTSLGAEVVPGSDKVAGLCISTLASHGHGCSLGEGLLLGKAVPCGWGQFPSKGSALSLQKPMFPEAEDGNVSREEKT